MLDRYAQSQQVPQLVTGGSRKPLRQLSAVQVSNVPDTVSRDLRADLATLILPSWPNQQTAMQQLFGREPEITLLNAVLASGRAEFVALYGRRELVS